MRKLLTPKKILIAVFIVIVITLPLVFRYIASQSLLPAAKNLNQTVTKASPTPKGQSPLDEIKRLSEQPTNSKTASSSGLLPALNFGPTLNIKIIVEGHPASDQSLKKVFVGIAAGGSTSSPNYLLSFTVDFPQSGLYSGLSLAGLNIASQYTAYIKGPGQLATSSAFTLLPDQTNLNNAQPLTLLSGDLNDDNVINSADYSLAKSLYGTTPKSSNWNERADFNLDGVINSADLAYIIKNFGKTGNSGVWVSPPPPPATKSGSLNLPSNIGGVSMSSSSSGYEVSHSSTSNPSGYWLWVPQ